MTGVDVAAALAGAALAAGVLMLAARWVAARRARTPLPRTEPSTVGRAAVTGEWLLTPDRGEPLETHPITWRTGFPPLPKPRNDRRWSQ